MEKQVVFRDRQEGQAQDMNNLQAFVDQSLRHLVGEAITAERQFYGLVVTATTATEIEVSAGGLWDGPTGRIYRKDQAERVSVFSHLPVQDQRWLAVGVSGQELETDIQPRDFLVDLDTGQTEPRAVAMELDRQVVLHITPGLESADPQKPEPPTGYTAIAHVRLGVGGVLEIVVADNKRLMRLFEVWRQGLANLEWITANAPKIEAIISDLASLTNRLAAMKEPINLNELAADVALLKDYANLPDDYSSYGADNFLDQGESDLANTEYVARVDEGVRFPWAGQAEVQPALFNPYETAVKNRAGLILPAYSAVARLTTSGYAGELSISQYPYETHQLKQGSRTKTRVRYGPTRDVCTNGANWQTGGYDFVTNVFEGPANGWEVLEEYGQHGQHRWLRIREYWRDTYTEPYWYVETTTHSINGSQVAQTFLAPSSGWLTGVNLMLKPAQAGGVVYLHLCETSAGMPDKGRCLAATQVDAANLRTNPEWTSFEFPQPVFVRAGARYAFCVTTAGAHGLALVQGAAYSNGTLFHSTDGAYFQGDFTRDLMFALFYAQFNGARAVVELAPISLSGGIADFDLLLEAVTPDSTDLIIEYQKSGDSAWHAIAEGTAGQLLGLPALVHLRAVFVGSRDLMPGLALPGSRIKASRPALSFRHISANRTLATPSKSIDVILRLEGWDAAKHTCQVMLISGGQNYFHTGMTETRLDDATIKRTYAFAPNAAASGVGQYQIKIVGTTTTALDLFHVAQRMDVAK